LERALDENGRYHKAVERLLAKSKAGLYDIEPSTWRVKTSMIDLVFFDTNVLLYLYDRRSPEKRERASALFSEHAVARALVISTQVAQEFYVSVTKKLGIHPSLAKLLWLTY